MTEKSSMDDVRNAEGMKLIIICLGSDLRIVNGRAGDDRDIGQFTFMSANRQSLIDYVLLSQSLCPLLATLWCMSLTLVLLMRHYNLTSKRDTKNPNSQNEAYLINKIAWNDDKNEKFRDILISKVEFLNGVVNEIVQTNSEINNG